ncbi:MAG: hypothetical protein UH080_07610 [Ruminococcus sp.]|nr:hypothetical protein [Ruminococcus sp.]
MFNCFKEKCYLLNLNPERVIGKLKSETLSSNRLANADTVFRGEFCDNSFKLQIRKEAEGNIFIHQSYSPVFFGNVTKSDGHTNLNIKMRPDFAGYAFAVVPAVIWIFMLISTLVVGTKLLASFLVFTIVFLGFEAFFFKTSRLAQRDMNDFIKQNFSDNLVE